MCVLLLSKSTILGVGVMKGEYVACYEGEGSCQPTSIRLLKGKRKNGGDQTFPRNPTQLLPPTHAAWGLVPQHNGGGRFIVPQNRFGCPNA